MFYANLLFIYANAKLGKMTSEELMHLEKTVASAGSQLSTVATKLSEVEKTLGDSGEEIDDVCVMELLESMTEVKNEYQNLRKDIKEVQQLQKEMTNTLRYQMRAMQQTFKLLKKRIELKAPQN